MRAGVSSVENFPEEATSVLKVLQMDWLTRTL